LSARIVFVCSCGGMNVLKETFWNLSESLSVVTLFSIDPTRPWSQATHR